MNDIGGVSPDQLRSFIDRLENLESEKTHIVEHIKDVLLEAKSQGFDIKIIKQILRIRKMDTQERMEQEELLQLYMQALGE
jgi:uncharacterized protein (UPF0335 family)